MIRLASVLKGPTKWLAGPVIHSAPGIRAFQNQHGGTVVRGDGAQCPFWQFTDTHRLQLARGRVLYCPPHLRLGLKSNKGGPPLQPIPL